MSDWPLSNHYLSETHRGYTEGTYATHTRTRQDDALNKEPCSCPCTTSLCVCGVGGGCGPASATFDAVVHECDGRFKHTHAAPHTRSEKRCESTRARARFIRRVVTQVAGGLVGVDVDVWMRERTERTDATRGRCLWLLICV